MLGWNASDQVLQFFVAVLGDFAGAAGGHQRSRARGQSAPASERLPGDQSHSQKRTLGPELSHAAYEAAAAQDEMLGRHYAGRKRNPPNSVLEFQGFSFEEGCRSGTPAHTCRE